MADIQKRITDLFSNRDMVASVISLFSIVLVIWSALYFLFKLTWQSRKCADLPTKSNTLATEEALLNRPIGNFYIKSAYNCCSLGEYANDYVGTCMMSSIIAQGVRCLDFEIFSINDIPVVATSTSKSYNEKETYNSVPFSKVIDIISKEAFSKEYAPNAEDPLFIHLRIKSNNVKMFWALNQMIEKIENVYIGEVDHDSKMKHLKGKVIVIVHNQNKNYLSSGAKPNMLSGSKNFHLYKYDHLQNLSGEEKKEIRKKNEKNAMSMIIPSAGSNPENIDINKVINSECNMIAMRYQKNDPQLVNYNNLFAASAFILKSEVFLEK